MTAIASLREACRLWCDVDAPFEAAQTRLCIAEAMRALSDESNAGMEIETAKSVFEQMGAVGELNRARSMRHTPTRTRALRTLMFTDMVESTRLVELLGDDDWGRLLDWHDRTLRQCFLACNGQEVHHQGDGFFVAFSDPVATVSCAVAVQTTLTEHRRDHGFAPQVRIGVHAAEAVDLGHDYLGKGVHEAARVGAAAGPNEILVTEAVLESIAGRFPSGPTRTLTLKGLARPMLVASVVWDKSD